MASDARGVNDPSAVVAAALLTRICLLPLMLIPYLVGAAARDFAVAPRQLGFVAGGIIGGVGGLKNVLVGGHGGLGLE